MFDLLNEEIAGLQPDAKQDPAEAKFRTIVPSQARATPFDGVTCKFYLNSCLTNEPINILPPLTSDQLK